jgi:hypothetical protein
MGHFTRRACLLAWRDAVLERQRASDALQHHCTSVQRRALVKLSRYAFRQGLVRKCLASLLHRRKALAWRAWLDIVLERKERACRAIVLQRRVVARMVHTHLSTAFEAFKMWAILQRSCQALLGKVCEAHKRPSHGSLMCLRPTGGSDVAAARFHVARSTLTMRGVLCRVQHLRRSIAQAFARWAEYTFKQAAAAHILSRRLLALQRTAFVWWLHFVDAQHHERCLMSTFRERLSTNTR